MSRSRGGAAVPVDVIPEPIMQLPLPSPGTKADKSERVESGVNVLATVGSPARKRPLQPPSHASSCPAPRMGPPSPLPSRPAREEEVWDLQQAGFCKIREHEFDRWRPVQREPMPYLGGANFTLDHFNPPQGAVLSAVFAMFDIDDDGVVDTRDLSLAMSRLGHAASDDEIQQMIQLADSKRDGVLDFSEFCEYFLPCLDGKVNMGTAEVFAECVAALEMSTKYELGVWGTWHPELLIPEQLVCTAWSVTPLAIGELNKPNGCDNVWVRFGVSSACPQGHVWQKVDGQMQMVSCAPTGLIWGIDASHQVWVREGVSPQSPAGSAWRSVEDDALVLTAMPAEKWNNVDDEDKVRHTTGSTASAQIRWISASGVNKVWGIDIHGQVVARMGITDTCPMGTTWVRVGGEMVRVSVGPTGRVWALNRKNQVFVRGGIAQQWPLGTGWERIQGCLSSVAVARDAVWGIDDEDNVWCRIGVSESKPQGTSWVKVQGRMASISVGPTGSVWAVSKNPTQIWFRTDTNKAKPTGETWVAVDGAMSQVSAGACQLSD